MMRTFKTIPTYKGLGVYTWEIVATGDDGMELTIAALYTTEEEAQKAIGVLQRYEVEQEQRGTIDPTEDGLAIPNLRIGST
jgi:hypothetical protein